MKNSTNQLQGPNGGKIRELHTRLVANGPSEPDPLRRGWNFRAA